MSHLLHALSLSLLFITLLLTNGASANRGASLGGVKASYNVKRSVSQVQWDGLVTKGRALNCQFPMTPEQAAARGTAQSQYTTAQHAEDFGWSHPGHGSLMEDFGIDGAASLWNLNLDESKGEYCGWMHSEDYTHPTAGFLDSLENASES